MMPKVRVNCGPAPEDCAVKLFGVWNTNYSEMLILARDMDEALRIAGGANHYYTWGAERAGVKYPRAEEIKSPEGGLSAYWPAIQSAISQRFEGTVHFENGSVTVGYQMIVAAQDRAMKSGKPTEDVTRCPR